MKPVRLYRRSNALIQMENSPEETFVPSLKLFFALRGVASTKWILLHNRVRIMSSHDRHEFHLSHQIRVWLENVVALWLLLHRACERT